MIFITKLKKYHSSCSYIIQLSVFRFLVTFLLRPRNKKSRNTTMGSSKRGGKEAASTTSKRKRLSYKNKRKPRLRLNEYDLKNKLVEELEKTKMMEEEELEKTKAAASTAATTGGRPTKNKSMASRVSSNKSAPTTAGIAASRVSNESA